MFRLNVLLVASNVKVGLTMININYFKIFLLFVLTWHIGHNRIKSQKTELDDEMDVGQLTFGYCLKNHSFLIVCGLSLEGCLNECAIRKKCKSFNYIKLYLLCELNELDQSDSSLQICHGSAYMDVSSQHSVRRHCACLYAVIITLQYCCRKIQTYFKIFAIIKFI